MRAPYLLVVQHHDIPAITRLAAPVTLSKQSEAAVLAPAVTIGGDLYRARLLDFSPVPVGLLSGTVDLASVDRDAVLDALDIILHGYPIGRPR